MTDATQNVLVEFKSALAEVQALSGVLTAKPGQHIEALHRLAALALTPGIAEQIRGGPCETCHHSTAHASAEYKHKWITCDWSDLDCAVHGFGCWAWEKKR